MIRKSIPSSMNKYNCTAIKYAQLLRIARHETSQKPSVAYQYTALLFQITICCLWRQKTPLIKPVFHPASYTCTVDCSLSGILAKLEIRRLRIKITWSRDFACVLRNLKIGCAISRFECNLRILRMCKAIPRLCKFSDCAEHFHFQTVRAPIGGAPYIYAKERDGPFLSVSTPKHERAPISCRQQFDANN